MFYTAQPDPQRSFHRETQLFRMTLTDLTAYVIVLEK